MNIFTTNVTLNKEVPVNSGSEPNSSNALVWPYFARWVLKNLSSCNFSFFALMSSDKIKLASVSVRMLVNYLRVRIRNKCLSLAVLKFIAGA